MSSLVFDQGKILRRLKGGILIDSGPLLLLLVGWCSTKYIQRCTKLKGMSKEMFNIAEGFVKKFRYVVVTPHILAEVSNLINDLPEETAKEVLIECSKRLQYSTEIQVTKDRIFEREEFSQVGVADTAILVVSEEQAGNILPLVQDRGIIGRLEAQGIDYINFTSLVTM